MRQIYKDLLKEAKKRRIETRNELENLLREEKFCVEDGINGGEFECAVKTLKLMKK